MTVIRIPAALDGHRGSEVPRIIVLHSTEGPTARSAANWFANPKSRASAHFVVDEKETIRCVEDARVAWAAQGTHQCGLQLEIAGYAKWSRDEWLARSATLDRAAMVIADWCLLHGIPPSMSEDPATISAKGWRGITTHVACNAAFPGKSNHWDPGPGFPRDVLVARVRGILAPQPSTAPDTDPATPSSISTSSMRAVREPGLEFGGGPSGGALPLGWQDRAERDAEEG